MVPVQWTRMIGRLREAQVARFVMKDPGVSGPSKDDAIKAYCHAMDGIFDDLDALQEQGVIGRLTAYLSRKERS